MEYEDFVIQLGADTRGSTVRVARSPAGESEPELLSLSINEREIAGLASAFGRAAAAARSSRHVHLHEVTEPSLTDIGDRLFRALFPEAVRNRYQQSRGRVAERGKGLRIRIEVGLGLAGLARLHAIPWEYLADDGQFLALSRELSLVRHLSLGLPSDRPAAEAPLSILVLAGEILTKSDLNLAGERTELEKAWTAPENVRIHVLPECTLEALREELLTTEYHALHFMGHGDFSPATGEGTLAFRNKEGLRIYVSGAELADQVRDRTSLRLVFLNACETASIGVAAPYAGVATALLRVGVPAVVAMQFPISDAAALTLSRTFYRRIARGDTVDAALAEGRIAIRRLGTDNTEWGTPVLFERLTSGQIVKNAAKLPLRRNRSLGLWAAIALAAFLTIISWPTIRSSVEQAGARETQATPSAPEKTNAQDPTDSTDPFDLNCASATHNFDTENYPVRIAHDKEVFVGEFGIVDGEFKLSLSLPNNLHKRCPSCEDVATDYRVVANVRKPPAEGSLHDGTWGIFFLDDNEKWYSLELNRENIAALKHYSSRSIHSSVVLSQIEFVPLKKNHLSLEFSKGSILAAVNGKQLPRLMVEEPSQLAKLSVGSGFIVTTRNSPPIEAYFDDFTITTCVR